MEKGRDVRAIVIDTKHERAECLFDPRDAHLGYVSDADPIMGNDLEGNGILLSKEHTWQDEYPGITILLMAYITGDLHIESECASDDCLRVFRAIKTSSSS